MKLLLDVGNTRLKCGWLDTSGGREPAAAAFAHADLRTALPAWLAALPHAPSGAIGANVAGPIVAGAVERVLQHAGLPGVTWLAPPAASDALVNGYREPAKLGADRWFALLGLCRHPRHRLPASAPTARILATFGTATTVDTVSAAGRFEGGLILPGIRLMLEALASGTADLPLAAGPATSFPTHTEAAIVTGVLAAQSGAVLRQYLAVRERFASDAIELAVTGGAWPALQGDLRQTLAAAGLAIPLRVLDNPVLDGLAIEAARRG